MYILGREYIRLSIFLQGELSSWMVLKLVGFSFFSWDSAQLLLLVGFMPTRVLQRSHSAAEGSLDIG